MNTLDIERLANAARLPIIQRKIAELKREAESFKRDCRGMFDRTTEKFLHTADEVKQAQTVGHAVSWELWPNLVHSEVEECWNVMQEEIEAAEQEAAALEGDAR